MLLADSDLLNMGLLMKILVDCKLTGERLLLRHRALSCSTPLALPERRTCDHRRVHNSPTTILLFCHSSPTLSETCGDGSQRADEFHTACPYCGVRNQALHRVSA